MAPELAPESALPGLLEQIETGHLRAAPLAPAEVDALHTRGALFACDLPDDLAFFYRAMNGATLFPRSGHPCRVVGLEECKPIWRSTAVGGISESNWLLLAILSDESRLVLHRGQATWRQRFDDVLDPADLDPTTGARRVIVPPVAKTTARRTFDAIAHQLRPEPLEVLSAPVVAESFTSMLEDLLTNAGRPSRTLGRAEIDPEHPSGQLFLLEGVFQA